MNTHRSVVESSCGSCSESDWDYGLGVGPPPVTRPPPDGIPRLTLPKKEKAGWGASLFGAGTLFGGLNATEGSTAAARGCSPPTDWTAGGQGSFGTSLGSVSTTEEGPVRVRGRSPFGGQGFPPPRDGSASQNYLSSMPAVGSTNGTRHHLAPRSGATAWPDTHPMSGGPIVRGNRENPSTPEELARSWRVPAHKATHATGGTQRPATSTWHTAERRPAAHDQANGVWWSTMLPDFAACRQAPIPSGDPRGGATVVSRPIFSCSGEEELVADLPSEDKKSARHHCGEIPKDRQSCTSLTDICEENIHDLLFRDATVELEENVVRTRVHM